MKRTFDESFNSSNKSTNPQRNNKQSKEEEEDDEAIIVGENMSGIASPTLATEEDFPVGLRQCKSVGDFKCLNQIGQGTYGIVCRAKNIKTNEIFALKKIKMTKEIIRNGFPLSALREIHTLLQLKHENVIRLHDVVVGSDMNKIYMVMEYAEHTLRDLIEGMEEAFSISSVKCLLQQLLRGVAYLHENWVVHRDLKTSNLLMKTDGTLKICDFGLARKFGTPLRDMSPVVVTLWYRAPELLLGETKYSTGVDIWSVGCIFFELLANRPLFDAKTEMFQLNKIFSILGFPDEKRWEGFTKLPGLTKWNLIGDQTNKLATLFKIGESDSNHPLSFLKNMTPSSALSLSGFPLNALNASSFPSSTSASGSPGSPKTENLPKISKLGFDLLSRMLELDPKKRISAAKALEHPFFTESPPPQAKEFLVFNTMVDSNSKLDSSEKAAKKRRFDAPKNVNVQNDSIAIQSPM